MPYISPRTLAQLAVCKYHITYWWQKFVCTHHSPIFLQYCWGICVIQSDQILTFCLQNQKAYSITTTYS